MLLTWGPSGVVLRGRRRAGRRTRLDGLSYEYVPDDFAHARPASARCLREHRWKHTAMAANPNVAAGAAPAAVGPGDGRAKEEDAFDMWLRRSLRGLFGAIAAEPVPDDLLRLIGEDHAEREGP